MKQVILLLVLTAYCSFSNATVQMKSVDQYDWEHTCVKIQKDQQETEKKIRTLATLLKESDLKLQALSKDNAKQNVTIDSLQNVCRQLESAQTADRKSINSKIETTDTNVLANQETLQKRTLLGGIISFVICVLIIGLACWLTKRIKRSTSSINDVRKAQDALKFTQEKMQEESIKLDDKLLEILNKQMATQLTPSFTNGKETIDHSLALKVADEIVRIELNMSRMDSSIKGYKQLAKAVERIKNNFQANGYEIVDMLGKPYNEGMKVIANFVVDETLEAGKQIITGITKPQINYNGLMIQAAQITVSQNI